MSRLVQSDLFKRVPKKWGDSHAALLGKTLLRQEESVADCLKREFEWDGVEAVATVLARFDTETKKFSSSEWATVGELWEAAADLDGWGGFTAADGQKLDGLEVKWKVNGASVEWRRDGQTGRNVSCWLTLLNDKAGSSCEIVRAGGEPLSPEAARDEFDLDLASFKENATFRFILQNTPDPEFLVCYCQTHFKFGGAERVNMESWPSLKSCPEIIPGIAVKHGKEKNLGRSIRYSSFVLPLWKQRLTG